MQHSSSSLALSHLQNIFPTLILPPFQNTHLSFLETLNVPHPSFSPSPTPSPCPQNKIWTQLSWLWESSWTNSSTNTKDHWWKSSSQRWWNSMKSVVTSRVPRGSCAGSRLFARLMIAATRLILLMPFGTGKMRSKVSSPNNSIFTFSIEKRTLIFITRTNIPHYAAII